MQACHRHNETLMLDVFGEIADPGARRTWEAHLRYCAGCRLERERMAGLVKNLRAAGGAPELPPARARAMAAAIKGAIADRAEAAEQRSRFRFMGRPALAAACALVVIAVGGYLAQDRLLRPARIAGLSSETQLPEQDLDVIKNLDLLKEMETLEKLVHVVDLPDDGQAPDDGQQSETQGMKRDGNGHGYA